MYKHLIRPVLFCFQPETAHSIVLNLLQATKAIPFGSALMRLVFKRKARGLSRNVFGIEFPHPVGLAAGFDKNGEHYNELADLGFSFIEIGSLTPLPQDGNPKPRLFRLPKDKAVINRMGINNKGIEAAIKNIQRDPPKAILAASIAKNSSSTSDEEIAADYSRSFSFLYDFVDIFTVNVSCPNVEGLQNLQDISYLSDIIDPLLELRVCYDTYKPILIKVSPDIPHDSLDEILKYCLLSGVDGIIAGNTTRSREGLSIPEGEVKRIGNGGLSGAPLYEKSLALVKHIHEKTAGRLPVVGVGGIMTPEQAQEMLDSGASLVQVYTGMIYEGPGFVRKIIRHLQSIQKKKTND